MLAPDVIADGEIFVKLLAILRPVGVPAGVPVADDLQAKSIWMYFATHELALLLLGLVRRSQVELNLALAQNNSQVRRAVNNRLEASPRPEATPGTARPFVGVNLRHDHVGRIQLEVIFGVSHRTLEHLQDHACTLLRHEL